MNKCIKTTMAIALIALASSAGIQTTQAHNYHYFFAQEENGQVKEIGFNDDKWTIRHIGVSSRVDKAKTTEIIIPKTSSWQSLQTINVEGITNLTRIVLEFQTEQTVTIHVERTKMDEGEIIHTAGMNVKVEDNGFLGPIRRIRIDPNNAEDMAKPEAKHFREPMIRTFLSIYKTPTTQIYMAGRNPPNLRRQ